MTEIEGLHPSLWRMHEGRPQRMGERVVVHVYDAWTLDELTELLRGAAADVMDARFSLTVDHDYSDERATLVVRGWFNATEKELQQALAVAKRQAKSMEQVRLENDKLLLEDIRRRRPELFD